ncbi:lysophospholipid acyltransferase family protein [Rhodoglobus aureus]|uniref:Phospholipid/glycerol acyltransferase domain-containing protein n=1 Tax=Rhodoglobus aureus TaxID=191497 RepID=A0ABN1VCC9_9MICO
MTRTFDRFSSPTMAGARFVAQRGLLKPLVWSLVRVEITGVENIEGHDGPFIAVANHSSHLDAPLIIGALPQKRARYLAAGAAADYFFEVWWRKWLTVLFFNAFAIERSSERKRAGSSRSLLGRGIPILIFPEGGRTREGVLTRFKPGAAALSILTSAPCLPIALVGASSAMPRGKSWPNQGRPPVTVVFGELMYRLDSETSEAFSTRLADTVRQLHETVQPMPSATPKGTQ